VIAVPTLIVANQGDACSATPPRDTAVIIQALPRTPRKEVIPVQSSETRSALRGDVTARLSRHRGRGSAAYCRLDPSRAKTLTRRLTRTRIAL
jgi:hypothetical protein